MIKMLERARHGNYRENRNHEYIDTFSERPECDVETVVSLLCLFSFLFF